MSAQQHGSAVATLKFVLCAVHGRQVLGRCGVARTAPNEALLVHHEHVSHRAAGEGRHQRVDKQLRQMQSSLSAFEPSRLCCTDRFRETRVATGTDRVVTMETRGDECSHSAANLARLERYEHVSVQRKHCGHAERRQRVRHVHRVGALRRGLDAGGELGHHGEQLRPAGGGRVYMRSGWCGASTKGNEDEALPRAGIF